MNELRRVAAIAVVCAALASPTTSFAKSQRNTYHTLERIWPTVIRFIRIDMGYTIIDKDRDNGYVLFEFEDDNRKFRGSLELIRAVDTSGRDELRMVMELYDRPTWMEDMVMGKLEQKIYEEHGDPPKPKPKPEPEPKKPEKPDGDKKDGDGRNKSTDGDK